MENLRQLGFKTFDDFWSESYDNDSGTMFMGDTLGLIYPHGDFVQPNLPPPDFNKELLFDTLEKISKYELSQLAIAHFGIHNNPYQLIENAFQSIDNWVNFIDTLPDISNDEATDILLSWVKANYTTLEVDSETIDNYIKNMNPNMQIKGIRNYLQK